MEHVGHRNLLGVLIKYNYNPKQYTLREILSRFQYAPPREQLYLFGGPLTLPTFRARGRILPNREWRPRFNTTRHAALTKKASARFLKKY